MKKCLEDLLKTSADCTYFFEPQGVLGLQVSCALTVSFFCSASLNSA